MNKLPDIKVVLRAFGISFKDSDFTTRHTEVHRSAPSDPTLAIMPETPEQLQFAIETLGKFNQPFVIIAGETGYAGAQRASENEVHLDMGKFNQLKSITFSNGDVFEFEPQKRSINSDFLNVEMWKDQLHKFLSEKNLSEEELKNYTAGLKIKTEAGVSIGAVNEVLAIANQFIPFDAGSAKIGNASIGGVVANYSFGADAKALGSPADCCIKAYSFNGNGKHRIDEGAGGKLREFKEGEAALRADRLPLGNNAIGGQGTFSVTYELEMATKEIPAQRHVFFLKFDNYKQVANCIDSVEKEFPNNIRQIELMNRASVELVQKYNHNNYRNFFPSEEISNYYVMLDIMDKVKFNSESPSNIGFAVYDHLSKEIVEDRIATFGDLGEPIESVHKIRHSMSESSDNLAGKYAKASGSNNHKGEPDKLMHRVTVDMCVPKGNYGKILEIIESVGEKYGVTAALFGHKAANGGHAHFISEKRLDTVIDKKTGLTLGGAIKNDIHSAIEKLGGPPTSEHGVGQLYAPMWLKHGNESDRNFWLAVKLNEDSKNLINPNSNHFAELIKQLSTDDKLRESVKEIATEYGLSDTLKTIDSLKKTYKENLKNGEAILSIEGFNKPDLIIFNDDNKKSAVHINFNEFINEAKKATGKEVAQVIDEDYPSFVGIKISGIKDNNELVKVIEVIENIAIKKGYSEINLHQSRGVDDNFISC